MSSHFQKIILKKSLLVNKILFFFITFCAEEGNQVSILHPLSSMLKLALTFRGSKLHFSLEQHWVSPGRQSWRLWMLLSINLTWTQKQRQVKRGNLRASINSCFSFCLLPPTDWFIYLIKDALFMVYTDNFNKIQVYVENSDEKLHRQLNISICFVSCKSKTIKFSLRKSV